VWEDRVGKERRERKEKEWFAIEIGQGTATNRNKPD
jgi:hypothetical protein